METCTRGSGTAMDIDLQTPGGVRRSTSVQESVGDGVVGKLPTFPHFLRNVRYSAGMSSKNGYPTTSRIGVFDPLRRVVEKGGEDVEKVGEVCG